MKETIEAAVKRLFRHAERDGFEHVGFHTYEDENGAPLYYRVRMRHPTKPKFMRPMSLNGSGYVCKEPDEFADKKPLYGLSLLKQRPDETVWFVEGEACADALRKIGLLAVTAGSSSSHKKVDLEPLRGRAVITWADNAKDGRDHMAAIATKLILEFECRTVHAVDIDALNLPDKGDCIDWLAKNPTATAAEIEALVSNKEPLDEVEAFLRRFVAYPSEHARVAHTLWIAHTHQLDVFDSTPRIAFLSKEAGSGKSRALEATEPLVPNPVQAVNVTPSYLFRRVAAENGRPTILYDECDTLFGHRVSEKAEEVRGLINAGHRRHGVAGRCVVRGSEVHTEELPAYAAVALAGLGGLPDTIISRSIVVRMKRRAPHERVEPFRRRAHEVQGHSIRDRLAIWTKGLVASMAGSWPTMPEGVNDRDADIWESLLAIADAAGDTWPERARAAAVFLVRESKESTPSLGVRLLADLKRVFGERDAMSTIDILKALCELEEAPWSDLKGKSISPRFLSSQLKAYDPKIKPGTHRIGGIPTKGYARTDLHDTWIRYLAEPARETVTSVAPVTPDDCRHVEPVSVTAATDVTGTRADDPTTNKGEGMIKSDHWLLQLTGSKSQEIYYGELVELSQVMQDHPEAIAARPVVSESCIDI